MKKSAKNKIKIKAKVDNTIVETSNSINNNQIDVFDKISEEVVAQVNDIVSKMEKLGKQNKKNGKKCKFHQCTRIKVTVNNETVNRNAVEEDINKDRIDEVTSEIYAMSESSSIPINVRLNFAPSPKLVEIEKLINMTLDEFRIWLRREIIKFLDIIEKYKNPNDNYEFPITFTDDKIDLNKDNEWSVEKLEQTLKLFFVRSILFYSLQFIDSITDIYYRKIIITLCFSMRECLESITREMDKRSLRILYAISSFDKRYRERQLYGENTHHLRDYLNYPENVFVDLINQNMLVFH